MTIPYDFLEHALELQAGRIHGFAVVMEAGDHTGYAEDDGAIRMLVAYGHLLRYTAPELALAIVHALLVKYPEGLDALAVVNRVVAVANGETLWDLMTAKQVDEKALGTPCEQHGVDLGACAKMLSLAAKRHAERAKGPPRPIAGPGAIPASAPADAPSAPAASDPDPAPASPQ